MPTDIRLSLANTPGAFAKAARVLAEGGINIEGMASDIRPGESWGYLHLLVDDLDAAAGVLEAQGHEILDIHDVDLIDADDRPGGMADICQSYADRGENIEVLYICTKSRLAVGTESMRRTFDGRTTAETTYADRRRS